MRRKEGTKVTMVANISSHGNLRFLGLFSGLRDAAVVF